MAQAGQPCYDFNLFKFGSTLFHSVARHICQNLDPVAIPIAFERKTNKLLHGTCFMCVGIHQVCMFSAHFDDMIFSKFADANYLLTT